MTRALFEATRPYNWQPVEHYGPEGSDDSSEWDEQDYITATEFLDLAEKEINWDRSSATGLPLAGVKGSPDYAAQVDEHILLMGENIWLGFPDPPQFTIVRCHPGSRKTQQLGHFDNWPEKWNRPL